MQKRIYNKPYTRKRNRTKAYANDLWVNAEDNKKLFDILVSIDSYHYFATDIQFFENKILPVLKNNAIVLIGIPGVKDEYTRCSKELLPEWLGDESYMFKSPTEWRKIIGNHDRIEMINTWEMGCFNLCKTIFRWSTVKNKCRSCYFLFKKQHERHYI